MENKIENEKYLVVSLHDVSPAFAPELKEICQELEIQKIEKKNFLIIPCYQGMLDISRDDYFLGWLHSQIKEGNEPVQHGHQHTLRRYNSAREYFFSLCQGFISRQCAEFRNLKKEKARKKIRAGKKILHRAGINCRGFVPPWWAMSPETNQILKEEGFDYSASLFHLMDYLKGLKIKSEVIFSSQGWSDYWLRAYDFALVKMWSKKNNLVRIALHPFDIHRESSFLFLLKIIKDLKKNRTLTTYLNYLKR